MSKNLKYIICAFFFVLFYAGCGKNEVIQQKGDVSSEGGMAVLNEEKQVTSEELEILCQYLHIKKENITYSANLTETSTNDCMGEEEIFESKSYEIEVNDDKNKSGFYCIGLGENAMGEKDVYIAKELTQKEMKKLDISWENEEVKLCKVIYDGLVEDMERTKKEQGYRTPSICTSYVKQYQESLKNTKEIVENGYINDSGKYETAYIDAKLDGLGVGALSGEKMIFENNKWSINKFQIPTELNKRGYRDKLDFQYGQLWFCSSSNEIKVSDTAGNIIGVLDLNKWKEVQGLKAEDNITVQYMPNAKVIINVNGQKKSYLVNVKTGATIRTYDFHLEGKVYGKYMILQKESHSEFIQIVEWKTGKTVLKLDVSAIQKEYSKTEKYVGYKTKGDSSDERGFWPLEGENKIFDNNSKISHPIRSFISENQLYLSFFTGIYRYDSESNKLNKILDGKKLLKYQNMYSTDFDVASDETFFLLGSIAGEKGNLLILK